MFVFFEQQNYQFTIKAQRRRDVKFASGRIDRSPPTLLGQIKNKSYNF